MSFMPKPVAYHPALPKNAQGLTRRDYEGTMSTLCAGCGHDSITAALIRKIPHFPVTSSFFLAFAISKFTTFCWTIDSRFVTTQ